MKEKALTYEQLKSLLEEDRREILESRKEIQENKNEWNKRDLEWEKSRKEWKEIRQSMKDNAERFKETDIRFKETDIRFKEAERYIKELSKNINGIADSNGKVAETLISNTLENNLLLNGWSFDYADIDVKKHVKSLNIKDQYDLVLGNDSLLAIIEIKYRLRSDSVIDLAKRKLPNYKKLFPNETRNIVGVVAGMSIDKEAIETAKENGIYAITLSGEQIKVENSIYKEFN